MFAQNRAAFYLLLTTLVLNCGHYSAAQNTARNPRCHVFESSTCNTSLYELPGFVKRGWFFHVMFNSCREYYVNRGDADCTENTNLFQTFEECNSVCGVRCKLPNNEDGLCTYKNYAEARGCRHTDKPASYSRTPCHAYEVECCPVNTVLTIQG
ncbi:hypothetical protein M8J77_015646 [Diaphorina citri]|nr:hypothetical protein M8J77_015646 [Diaphorina citri]